MKLSNTTTKTNTTSATLFPNPVMALGSSEQKQDLSNIAPCRSRKEQQKNISAFLEIWALRSTSVPRLLLAQYDEQSITVYQAYKPAIGLQAARQGNFLDSDFSFSRMTWIKPNFSWMMYRSGWGNKKNQETILAIKLRREYFDQLLSQAVQTSWDDSSYGSVREWSKALKESDVLVQWDPDHKLVTGHKLPYRVLQLGIRRQALEGFKGSGIISISNITEQAQLIGKQILRPSTDDPFSEKVLDFCNASVPLERRYPVSDTVRKTQRLS